MSARQMPPGVHPDPSGSGTADPLSTLRDAEVVFMSWRDTANPEGGGAERYLEKMAVGLVERGCRVTIFAAAHDAAPADEVRDGIRFVRRGSKLSVYAAGMRALRRGDLGTPDVVVDVQNGLPFFTPLVTRAPVVVLVHHVHREQWPVVYPGLTGRVGWWIERRLSPWLYRHRQYVAVSSATAAELRETGVRGPRIALVHNGTDPWVALDPADVGTSPDPLVAVVGRLVPHKQVEHAVDAVARLRTEVPELAGLRLSVVGDGWWGEHLAAYVSELGLDDAVSLEGHVSEERKHAIYEAAWVLALPSLKEGWGLVIGEAGMHSTPAVAYASAGGTQESISHGVSGLLVADQEEFTAALREILMDGVLRGELGEGANKMSQSYTWGRAQDAFAQVLTATLRGRLVDGASATEQREQLEQRRRAAAGRRGRRRARLTRTDSRRGRRS